MFRLAAAGAMLFGLLTFWGCRMTYMSAGASSEAVELDLTTWQIGDELPDNHVDLEGFFPLLEKAHETDSEIFIPLAPLATGANPPENEFDYNLLAAQTKMIASISKSTATEDQIIGLMDGKGMYLGTCGDACPGGVRDAVKRRIKKESINDLPLIELAREPSMMWGIITLIVGLIGFVGSSSLTWFGFAADDND